MHISCYSMMVGRWKALFPVVCLTNRHSTRTAQCFLLSYSNIQPAGTILFGYTHTKRTVSAQTDTYIRIAWKAVTPRNCFLKLLCESAAGDGGKLYKICIIFDFLQFGNSILQITFREAEFSILFWTFCVIFTANREADGEI